MKINYKLLAIALHNLSKPMARKACKNLEDEPTTRTFNLERLNHEVISYVETLDKRAKKQREIERLEKAKEREYERYKKRLNKLNADFIKGD